MHPHRFASRLRGHVPLAALFAALALAATAPRALAQVALPDGFRDSLVVGSLNLPTSLAFLPDGRLLFVEQTSKRIRLLVRGALSPTDPVGTVDSVNTSGLERGLLGIAVDPGWPARPYVYVHCDHANGNTIRISRYELQGDLAGTGSGALALVAGSRRDILAGLPDAASNHNGGTVRFGTDGKLYASIGDDAMGCLAQDITSWHGVIFRLDVSNVPAGGGPAPSLATITPADNPFVGNASPAARLVWAFGLRNPFRFHVDYSTGGLFVTDVGENTWEEVNQVTAGGKNLGWPGFEANETGDPTCPEALPPTFPIYAYDHSFGQAVISAGQYPPIAVPAAAGVFPSEYGGDYFFSDYYTGYLWRLKRTAGNWAIAPPVAGQPDPGIWAFGFDGVSDWMPGPDGMLWYCRQYTTGANTGQIGAIAWSESTPPPPPPPPGPVARVSFATPYPQPSGGVVTLAFNHSVDGVVTLRVFDLRGRLVRVLMDRRLDVAGDRTVVWDGLDDDGRKAPSGLYVAKLEAPGGERARRIVLVR